MVVWALWAAGAFAADPVAETNESPEPEEGSDVDIEPEPEPEPEPDPYPIRWPGQCTEDDPHFDLEILYYERDYEQGLAQADARLAEAPDKDLYWLKARFLYEIGEKFQRDDPNIDKEAHYENMLDAAEAGLALAPDDLHLRFARGIAKGRLGTTRGVLASLFMAKDIEADWLAAASGELEYASIGGQEILPCDAHYALGIFYRLVPDYWIVQVLAGTRGDLDKSAAFHSRAVACKGDQVEKHKELAATQLCIGTKRKDEAMIATGRATALHATTLTPRSDKQRIDIKHSQMLADDPSLGCEYSRDGQQDLDEKKIKK